MYIPPILHLKMPVVKTVDGRIKGSAEDPVIIGQIGPTSTTYQTINAASSSTSTSNFTIIPPSTSVGLNRYVNLNVVGYMDIVGTNLGIGANEASYALRSFPLNSCISSCQVQINNASVTLANGNQFIPYVYNRVANSALNSSTYQSGTAATPDFLTNYDDGLYTTLSPFGSALAITAGDSNYQSRTAQITGVAVSPGGTAGTNMRVSFNISEPLLVSVFTSDKNSGQALFGLNAVNITINWQNLQRLISITNPNAGITITSSALTFTAPPKLYISYVTPPASVAVERPLKNYYGVSDLRIYSTNITGAVAGASFTGITNSIMLPRCPKYIILYATDTLNYQSLPDSATIADRCFPITAVSISAYDRSGLLASCSPQQLYEISLSNGLRATMSQYLGSVIYGATGGGAWGSLGILGGQPLVIDLAKDCSVADFIANGVDVQTQFTANCTILNNTADNLSTANSVSLNVLVVTDGYLITDSGAAEFVLGGITQSDLMSAEFLDVDATTLFKGHSGTIAGGGFFGDLWDSIKNIGSTAASVIKPFAAPIADAFVPGAGQMVGKFLGQGKAGAMMSGARMDSGAMKKKAGYY